MNNSRPTIGFLTPGMLWSGNGHKMWRGALQVAQTHDVNLMCFVGEYVDALDNLATSGNILYELVDQHRFDALVIRGYVTSKLPPQQEQAFYRAFGDIPMVVMGCPIRNVPHIMMDNYAGVREAMIHLIDEHQCRRIAFIRGPDYHDPRERFRAYVDMLDEAGIEYDPVLVSPSVPFWPDLMDQRDFNQKLEILTDNLDAVVCASDGLAFNVMTELQQQGVRVPDDVLVIGYDNSDRARWMTPPMTTVDARFYDQGSEAMSLVLHLLDGHKIPEQVLIPTRLIVRESCGCLPKDVAHAYGGLMDHQSTSETDYINRIIREFDLSAYQDDVKHLTEIFAADVDNQTNYFVKELDHIMLKAVQANDDKAQWQELISSFRHCFLSDQHDEATRVHIENIWQQARIIAGRRMEQVQARRAIEIKERSECLDKITQALVTTFDLAELMDLLAHELPRIGIPSAYLSLYVDAGRPHDQARLLMAYVDIERVDIPDHGVHYPTMQIVPNHLLPQNRCYSLVVEPLHFQKEQLGLIVFEAGLQDGNMYDTLGGQLSSILKGGALFNQNIQLYEEARQAQKIAEDANQLKSRFLASVSHELRTPLNLLVGLSEMMLNERQEIVPQNYLQDLERIHIGAKHLDNLLRDVMDLARSQVGHLRMTKEPLNIGKVVLSVEDIARQMVVDKGLTWVCNLPQEMPYVLCDPTRIKQIILNLVSNAVKFTETGGIELNVEVIGQDVSIQISDTGLGIPVAEQNLIFDEFRTSERTALRGYGGLGLGLAICRQLIELHDGEIGVYSSGIEGEGSTFFFRLPVTIMQAKRQPEVILGGETILLLTESGSHTLQTHLYNEGFDIYTVVLNDAAFDLLPQILTESPAAIILDAQPDSLYGWNLVYRLKEHPATAETPILFYSMLEDRNAGSTLMLDYLTKPVGTATLTRALARYGLRQDASTHSTVVMVVDDDVPTLEMHALAVQSNLPDCQVIRATNGQMALDLMNEYHPDLVILDLMMPVLDGFGVLATMKDRAVLRDIPVIVMTGADLTHDDLDRLNSSVSKILSKGIFSADETLVHIKSVLTDHCQLGGDMQQVVRHIIGYIHRDYQSPLTRSQLAAYACVSERHMDRCFQQVMNITPTTYLNRYRIKQAKKLLQTIDLSIGEIATQVGFSSSTHFGRAFKREVGVSPSAYQQGDRPATASS